jgi:hypothetical protein
LNGPQIVSTITNTETNTEKNEAVSMSLFLESVAPGTKVEVKDPFLQSAGTKVVNHPDLTLHCTECDGSRVFESVGDDIYATNRQFVNGFLYYRCRNCHRTFKTFAVNVSSGAVMKYGESPAFGPPLPSRLLRMIQSDLDLFMRGRRAENQGLGMGAFAYYRRVVENQKNRLLEEILKVARKSGADASVIGRFDKAMKEVQFSGAVEDVKDVLPKNLLLDGGHNPLVLLHSALNKGIHANTEEECLELAGSIRLVLADLADRISQILKERTDLNNAVKRLLSGGS